MADVSFQLRGIEARPSAAILSVGGNDAMEDVDLLDRRVATAAAVLDELLTIAESFTRRYEKAARAVAERLDHTVLCTIYEVQLEPAEYARLARVSLAILNDRIVRTGARLGLDVLELREVCSSPSDFVQQIEPSPAGAEKIARAIAGVLEGEPASRSGRVYSG